MDSAEPSVFKIVPTTQQYDWGKRDHSSIVAQLSLAYQAQGFKIADGTPYAEVNGFSL
jgi:mannose-6-phosphate isomerase